MKIGIITDIHSNSQALDFPINEITTETLRNYLSNYKNNSSAGMVTIDNK